MQLDMRDMSICGGTLLTFAILSAKLLIKKFSSILFANFLTVKTIIFQWNYVIFPQLRCLFTQIMGRFVVKRYVYPNEKTEIISKETNKRKTNK